MALQGLHGRSKFCGFCSDPRVIRKALWRAFTRRWDAFRSISEGFQKASSLVAMRLINGPLVDWNWKWRAFQPYLWWPGGHQRAPLAGGHQHCPLNHKIVAGICNLPTGLQGQCKPFTNGYHRDFFGSPLYACHLSKCFCLRQHRKIQVTVLLGTW